MGDEHISFTTGKIGSLADVAKSRFVLFRLIFPLGFIFASFRKGTGQKNKM